MLLEKPFYKDLAILIGVFVLVILFLRIIKTIVIKKVSQLTEKTDNKFDDILIKSIDNIGWYFYLAVAGFFAARAMSFSQRVDHILNVVFLALITVSLIDFAKNILTFLIENYIEKEDEKRGKTTNKTIQNVLTFVVNVVLWSLGAAFVLENIGINVTAILGGIGIGGIAVAFALQNILGDLFSFFSIYFDNPFEVGDFIVVGETMGTVENIGIKSTRLRSLDGEEIVISNSQLTGSQINNFRKISKRRVVITIGVLYETPKEKLKKIPAMIKNIVDGVDMVELDRAHFSKFADSALEFEFVYYVLSGEYNDYMDINQKINYALVKRFKEEGIEFAYPTRQIYLTKN